jgi:hypothetical protein
LTLTTTIVIVPRGDEDRDDRPPACGVLRPGDLFRVEQAPT